MFKYIGRYIIISNSIASGWRNCNTRYCVNILCFAAKKIHLLNNFSNDYSCCFISMCMCQTLLRILPVLSRFSQQFYREGFIINPTFQLWKIKAPRSHSISLLCVMELGFAPEQSLELILST